MSEGKLNPRKVSEIYDDCCKRESPRTLLVEAITFYAIGFDMQKVVKHRLEINALCDELPRQFRRSEGGGQQFPAAKHDRDGNQWAADLKPVEQLLLLGIAVGKIDYLQPREEWNFLPGKTPFLVVND